MTLEEYGRLDRDNETVSEGICLPPMKNTRNAFFSGEGIGLNPARRSTRRSFRLRSNVHFGRKKPCSTWPKGRIKIQTISFLSYAS